MSIQSLLVRGAVVLAGSCALHAGPIVGTFRMDPVELVAGRESPGQESLAAERYQYRYLFANEENKREFEAHPEKYEIQMGGACGRMGLLSGAGNPDRYALHDDRIFIFASDQCRSTFLLDPSRVLDPVDTPVTTDEQLTRSGRELLERAIAAMGGAERLDAVRDYQEVVEKEITTKGEKHMQGDSLLIVFPTGVRKADRWDDSHWASVDGPDGALSLATGKEPRELQPVERDFLRRAYHHRHPITLLKARNEPGFLIAAAGSRTISLGGKKHRVEEVHVSYGGCTATLGFDPNTGLVKSMTFMGRQSVVGEVTRVYADYRDVSGLKVPMKYDVLFDGQHKEASAVQFSKILIDDPEAAAMLKKPG